MNEDFGERAWNRTLCDLKKHGISGIAYYTIYEGKNNGYNLYGCNEGGRK
jgi:hypothetical protein